MNEMATGGRRIHSAGRERLRAVVRRRYDMGESLSLIASDLGLSYGFARGLVVDKVRRTLEGATQTEPRMEARRPGPAGEKRVLPAFTMPARFAWPMAPTRPPDLITADQPGWQRSLWFEAVHTPAGREWLELICALAVGGWAVAILSSGQLDPKHGGASLSRVTSSREFFREDMKTYRQREWDLFTGTALEFARYEP